MKTTFIGLMAIATIFAAAESTSAQFTITLPKIPKIKKERPRTDVEPPSTTSTTSPDMPSSPSSLTSEVRGKPIAGARITFSNNPDGSNPKTSFSSSEYIYGRLDLGGKTVYDAFGLKNQTDVPIYYIHYDLVIYKPGEKPYEGNWGGNFNYTLVTKVEAQKTYWNFDVLPEPTKITTMKSMLANQKDFVRRSVAGIYSKWYDADAARSVFPQSGTYTIDVTVWGDAYDDWGKPIIGSDAKPTAAAMFALQFSGTDGQRFVANAETAYKTVEAAKNAGEKLHAMPDWWARGATPPEPKLATTRLVPLIKGYLGRWNLTYMKHMIFPFKGPVWAIEKNEFGIPRHRRMTSAIYTIYKDPKDNACKLGYLEMFEEYGGAGTYGAPYLGGIHDTKQIDCAVVK